MTVAVQSCTLADLRIRLNVTVNGISYALAIAYMGKMGGGLFSVITDRCELAVMSCPTCFQFVQ